MCVLLSKVYIQANISAKLDYVDNCGGGGNSNLFFIYSCEYMNCGFHFLYANIITLISKT